MDINKAYAYAYVYKRKLLINNEMYFNKMITALNDDKIFNSANLSFSNCNVNKHFIERFIDRGLKIDEILPEFYQLILRRRCEIIYYCYLKDKPKRLELEIDDILVGLSFKNNILTFRTVFKKYKNRHKGSISNFIINKNIPYYELEN